VAIRAESDSDKLKLEIMELRNGKGCPNNIKLATTLSRILDCGTVSHNKKVSCLVVIILEFLPRARAGLLLASLNLIQGYDDLVNADDRRLRYRDNFLMAQKKPPKVDSLRDNDNETILILAELIIEAKASGELKNIVTVAPPIPQLPIPKYFENCVDEWDIPPNYEYTLNKQTSLLGELQEMHGVTHKNIRVIAGHTKITPSIAGGVADANTKLDELVKMSMRMDKAEVFMDAQLNAGLNTIIYTILGENMSKYDPAEYEWVAENLKIELLSQMAQAVIERLPDQAVEEIQDYIDNNNLPGDEPVDMLIRQKATEYNVDIDTINFNTLMRFIEFYKHRAFSDIIETSQYEVTSDIAEIPQHRAEPEKLGMITPDDIPDDPDEFDAWLDDLYNNSDG